ncbi:retrovirus-related Pol polyprotein from transposon TNT 1-94 [Trichonephila clavipes]|nr:retrovirus-related Pol polyprotein from transposon TNT 1-94 [Trichonephila clavipes]
MAVTNYQIKPLDSSSYSTWSMDVWFLLHEKNCFEIVAGKESAPEIKEENQWEYRNNNRRYREYKASLKLLQHPHVPSPTGSSVSHTHTQVINTIRGSRRDRNRSFKDRNDLSRYHGSTNFVTHQNEGQRILSFFLAESNLSCNASNDAWILDKAASNHFTNNLDLFINFVDIANENMVLAVNGVEFPIEGKGDRGIKHERTNSYTPQQNGASERLNRTVIGRARTVLSESGLDKSFWPEAALYFVYVWNRQCHSGQTITPTEFYIVGFALGLRGYRVWIPEDSRVIETSNVCFQKPQQSNSEVVLASPDLKFSDYEVVENCDDDDKQ